MIKISKEKEYKIRTKIYIIPVKKELLGYFT